MDFDFDFDFDLDLDLTVRLRTRVVKELEGWWIYIPDVVLRPLFRFRVGPFASREAAERYSKVVYESGRGTGDGQSKSKSKSKSKLRE